jgi:hypothetical protein
MDARRPSCARRLAIATTGFAKIADLRSGLSGRSVRARREEGPRQTALIEWTGNKAAPGLWMSFAAVCGLVATLFVYRQGEASRNAVAAPA